MIAGMTSPPSSPSLALMGSKEIAYPLVSLLPESIPSNTSPSTNNNTTASFTPISTPAPSRPSSGTTSTPLYGSTPLAGTPLGHCPAASDQVKLALVSLGNQITRQKITRLTYLFFFLLFLQILHSIQQQQCRLRLSVVLFCSIRLPNVITYFSYFDSFVSSL